MIRAAKAEDSTDLQGRSARGIEMTGNFIRGKRRFGVLGALENLLVHLAVPTFAAGVAAGGVDDDQAAGGAGRRIEVDRTALQLKRPMDGVQNIAESEGDVGCSRIELDGNVTG